MQELQVSRYKEIDYVIRYPENMAEGEKYPLVIYVHGAGGRGRNIDLIREHGFFVHSEPHLKNAISVAPQCYADSWFDIFEQLRDFIEFAISNSAVDKARVYLMGASMGGYCTWQMAMSRPEFFAAIVPICGGGMYWNSGRLVHMGVWAFHGDIDRTVYPEESRKFINNIKAWGGNDVKLTIYENTGHDAWTPTFKCAEMWEWLFAHKNAYAKTENTFDDVVRFG